MTPSVKAGQAVVLAVLVVLMTVACGNQSAATQLASARSSLEKGDTKSAIVKLKSLLSESPSNAEARFLLGKALQESGEPVAALVELQKSRDLKYTVAEVIPLQARTLIELGQGKKLLEELSGIELATPLSTADFNTSMAVGWLSLNQRDKADLVLEKALLAVPTYARAVLLKSLLKASEGDFDAALALARGVVAAEPRNAEARFIEGNLLRLAKSDIAGALRAYRAAIEIRPKYMAAQSEIVSILLLQRDLPAAKAQFIQIRKLMPDSFQTRYFEAQFALLDEDFARARELATKLLNFNAENAKLLLLAGAIDYQAGFLVSAETHLSKAFRLAPQLPAVRGLMARTYLRTGKPAKALELLQPTLSSPKPDADEMALAAEAYLQSGNVERAEQLFKIALQANPDNPEMRTMMAMFQLSKGKGEVAFPELAMIAASDKGAVADLALITARLKRRDLGEALIAIAALEKKQPDRPLPADLRGRVLLQQRDIFGARKSFDRALVLDPSYLPAVESLAALDINDRNFSAARQRFEALAKIRPRDAGAYMGLARVRQLEGGTADEVVVVLSNAVRANTADPAPRLMLINTYSNQRAFSKANAAAQEAVAAIPDNPALVEVLGRTQAASGDLLRAKAAFAQLAALLPTSPLPSLRIAEINTLEKSWVAAISNYRRALELAPGTPAARQGLVSIAVERKQEIQVLETAKLLRKQNATAADGMLVEADIAAEKRNWPLAIATYREALVAAKNGSLPAQKLYSTLILASKPAEAESLANGWLRDHGKDITFLLNMAGLALARGDMAYAERRYKEVLALDPGQAESLNNVAWSLLLQGKGGALAYAAKAVGLVPDSLPFRDTLALAQSDAGQYDDAIKTQQAIIMLAPKDRNFVFTLAQVYAKAGRNSDALGELGKLAKMDGPFSSQAAADQLRTKLSAH